MKNEGNIAQGENVIRNFEFIFRKLISFKTEIKTLITTNPSPWAGFNLRGKRK